MPQILRTIDEYVATISKKETIWIVFNTVYNDVHAFHIKLDFDEYDKYLNKDYTDQEAQKEFLDFMSAEYPDTKIEQVFDLVSANHLVYPYLGSYVIDTEIGSEAYKALVKKYGDPYEDPTKNNAVLWVIDYENAKKFHDERVERLNAEFSDEE